MGHKRLALHNIGIDKDPEVIALWEGVNNIDLIEGDALELLKLDRGISHDLSQKDTLAYLDPPYLMETRSSKQPIYDCEMTDQDLERLLELILDLPCMVMISGYHFDMYAQALTGWRSITYQTRTRGGTTVTEWLWISYPGPVRLHDYRYLGDDFRERERIEWKTQRWEDRLKRFPTLERYTIFNAIDQVFPFEDIA